MAKAIRWWAAGATVAAAAGAAGTVLASASSQRRRGRAAVGSLPDRPAAKDLTVTASDGARLHVLTAGRGRPLLLVHGVTLSAELWRNQFADLAGDFAVHAVDQRGHGRSGLGSDPLDVPRLARDLAEVAEHLDLRDAVLVGHSLGGMVTLRAVQDHPHLFGDRIGAVVLMSTASGPLTPLHPNRWARIVEATEKGMRKGTGRSKRPLLADDLAGWMGARMQMGPGVPPGEVEFVRRIISDTAPATLADVWESMLNIDMRKALPTLRIPTTVVVGSRDLLTPPRMARAMAEHLPDAELVVLPGCGHYPMLERREDTARLIRAAAGRHAATEAA